MFVVIAKINQPVWVKKLEPDSIRKKLYELSIPSYEIVISDEELYEVMEANQQDECILFSNYPPDWTYPGMNNDYIGTSNRQNQFKSIENYNKSFFLFMNITRKHAFKAIHFITGAPESLVNDTVLKSFFCPTITVKRKNDLSTDKGLYSISEYILEKVNEAIKE